MKITLAFNLRKESGMEGAELLPEKEVQQIFDAIASLGHEVTKAELTCPPGEIVERLVGSKPDLIFNIAEGTQGAAREAYYPAIYEQLGLPYTGGGSSLLYVNLDKRLSEKILAIRGIKTPKGALINKDNMDVLKDLEYPLILKPNYGGSSMGITEDSVVESASDARDLIEEMINDYPEGIEAQQFIPGREISVPMLEAFPGKILEIVEHVFHDSDQKYEIYNYERKRKDEDVSVSCPPDMTQKEREDILVLSDKVLNMMDMPDLGRVDIRLHENGTPYFIETNPLPRILPDGSLIIAAKSRGLDYPEVMRHIIRSAALRYGIPLGKKKIFTIEEKEERPSCREVGIEVGRFPTGRWNAITDVEDIYVGHRTHIQDNVKVPGEEGKTTTIRTGITAVVPKTRDLFNNHLVAGGFVLNGIGEMSGLTQAIEWGWLETPILLTNTMSLGMVHTGIVQHMIEQHPELGRKVDVIIPIIGETNDGFLNDNRLSVNTPEEAMKAIENATHGPVEQGSVGGGTGMVTFDFSGGIGTSSRVIPRENGGYTVGVLVQSNFGKMRNLTVNGRVVGKDLDPMYPYDKRRGQNFGSIIVVIATDAPLLSAQLCRLSKRAALGLGRIGSFAASTSGEIIFAFSTGNRTSREAKQQARTLNLTFVTDEHINALYEAVIEATEEAVLNAIFCSKGMSGRDGRFAPPLPVDTVIEILEKGEDVQQSEVALEEGE